MAKSPRTWSELQKAFRKAGCEERTGGRHGVVFTHPSWDRPFPCSPHRGDVPRHILRGALRLLADLG